jgi:hypothetical protein
MTFTTTVVAGIPPSLGDRDKDVGLEGCRYTSLVHSGDSWLPVVSNDFRIIQGISQLTDRKEAKATIH